jgi:hypothetical protein
VKLNSHFAREFAEALLDAAELADRDALEIHVIKCRTYVLATRLFDPTLDGSENCLAVVYPVFSTGRRRKAA